MKFFAVVCLFVCTFFVAAQVQAVPIQFDFTTASSSLQYHPPETQPLPFLQNGLTLRVEAFNQDGLALDLAQNNNGLGAYSGGADSRDVDGSGRDEILAFGFSRQVKLLQVFFGLVGVNDEFTLQVDYGIFSTALEVADTVTLSKLGTVFTFGVVDSDDGYRIKGLLVELPGAPIPTPEPSSWLLLAAGVGGLFCARRKRFW